MLYGVLSFLIYFSNSVKINALESGVIGIKFVLTSPTDDLAVGVLHAKMYTSQYVQVMGKHMRANAGWSINHARMIWS